METNPIQTLESIKAIIANIKFRDWIFYVNEKNGVPYLQIQFMDKDFYSGKMELQKCRKWQMSLHMVNSEIVRTAFKAVKVAMEHEVDETFTYRGVRPFHPHMDLDRLVDYINETKGRLISIRPDQRVLPKNEEPLPEPMIIDEAINPIDEIKASYRKIFHGVDE